MSKTAGPCPYCGKQMILGHPRLRPTREHVVPVTRGGRAWISACFTCNNDKSDAPIQGWLGALKFRGDPRAPFVERFITQNPKLVAVVEPIPLGRIDTVPVPIYCDVRETDREKRWKCAVCALGFRTSHGAREHAKAIHLTEKAAAE